MRGPSKSARLVPRPPRRPREEEPQHRAADSNLGSRLPTEWQRCRPSFSTASPPGRPLRSGPGRNLVLHPKADRNRASTPTPNRIPPPPEPRETAQNFLIPGKLSEDLSCQRSQMAGTGWQSPQPAERPAAALVCQSLHPTRQSLRSSPPNLRGSLCASPTDRKPLPAPSASGTPSAASPTGTSP